MRKISIKTILNFYVIGPINWAQSFRSNGPALNMRAYTEDYLNKFTKNSIILNLQILLLLEVF